MGTKGYYGFIYKNKEYIIYHQFGSYPEGLGYKLIKQIKEAIENGSFKTWENKLENIVITTEAQTEEEQNAGDLNIILNQPIFKSSKIENEDPGVYGYIIDLDTKTFEFLYYGDSYSCDLYNLDTKIFENYDEPDS